jgi:hypothetical protein
MLEHPESLGHQSVKATRIGQSAGKDFAYVLGVFLGDGCVTPKEKHRLASGEFHYPAFRLNTIDEDFAKATAEALHQVSDYKVTLNRHEVKGGQPNHALRCGDPELCAILLRDTGCKQHLPEYVKTWPRENQLQLVNGLMDSEGYVAEIKNRITDRRYFMGFKSCDVWVPEFHRLMESLGIMASSVKTLKPAKAHYKTPILIRIKMQSWVDSGARFNIRRKQERVDRWAACEPYSQRSLYPRKPASETVREGAGDCA